MLKQLFKHKSKIIFMIFFIWFIIVDINHMIMGRSFFFKYDFPHNIYIYPWITIYDFNIENGWKNGMIFVNKTNFVSHNKKLKNILIDGLKYDDDYVFIVASDKKFGTYYAVMGLFSYNESIKKYLLGTKIFSEKDFKTTKYYDIYKNLKLHSTNHNYDTYFILFHSILARGLSTTIIFIFIFIFLIKKYKKYKKGTISKS